MLGPAAFPLLIFLMATLFSSVVGGVTSIGKFVGAASISGGFNGIGLFKSFFQIRFPSFQSVGTCPSSQILLRRMWSIFTVTSVSAPSASSGMFSGPAASPLLICLMIMLISSVVGGPTSIGRSVGAASMLGGFSDADRLKSSLKCSIHLIRCS
ncbi:unnamed protein product [Schistosoma mattheei]|uniref:Secreted protein n=1 Tax=Schistosoma mattheei TaxID=31246 RepID=A0A3P8GA10_9TREM|nr:unnamed protein product [Schistosoma mattheei]